MAKRGRPTKYSPKFCQAVIDYGEDGLSLTQIAAKLDVTRQTLYTWIEQHPDFLDAIEHSRTKSQAMLEQVLFEAALGQREVNTSLLLRTMQCRFPQHWTPSQHVTKEETVTVNSTGLQSLQDKIDAMAHSAAKMLEHRDAPNVLDLTRTDDTSIDKETLVQDLDVNDTE